MPLEDLTGVADDLEAAAMANGWAVYARSREAAAIQVRDGRIRAAKARGVSAPVIAERVGLSVAMVRVICR